MSKSRVKTKRPKVRCGACGIVSRWRAKCPTCGTPLARPGKKPRQAKPTLEQFKRYQAAYDYFNRTLFGNRLKPCLLVFRDGKLRNAVVFGHFAPHRWTKGDQTCHEISLNPDTLTRPLLDTMGTLVHEMVHQWQQDHGTPPRAGYHDREWAAKMLEVGLTPTDTGAPGGKMTGQRVTHIIDIDGAFRRAFEAMPPDIALPWATGGGLERAKKEPSEKKNKVKYTCPGCYANVWGKPSLYVVCGECDERYEPAVAS